MWVVVVQKQVDKLVQRENPKEEEEGCHQNITEFQVGPNQGLGFKDLSKSFTPF